MKKQDNLIKISTKALLYQLFVKDRLFAAGFILKLLFSFFFASQYLTELFTPFIKTAVETDYWNVYQIFFYVKSNAFPYPPVMLYILSVPGLVISFFHKSGVSVSVLDIFLIRIPLLLADIAILLVLIKWLRNRSQIIKWYWLNPIVIYISYVHGQLDIIPTAFLCIALYYLFAEKLWAFLLFLTLACATKFHVVITIPLLVVYLVKTKKVSILNLLKGASVFAGLLFLLNLPFLLQPEYVKMVYQNAEQGKVLISSLNIFDDYRLILIPAFYMIIFYLIIDFTFINRDILLIFLALSFGIVTFFIVPGQGWYMWNMPFLVYFMIRFNYQAKTLFIILNVAYFIFFIIFPESDIPSVGQLINPEYKHADNAYQFLAKKGFNAAILVQLAFTFLQTSLLLMCVSIFRIGVVKIRGHKIYYQPYLIGICGDSGTGKSTLSTSVQNLFGAINTLLVKGDDMHRWERGHEKWSEFTHLNPQANWLHRDLSQLMDLKAGKKIRRKFYDHDTGKFSAEQVINPNKIILYEGLHSFYLNAASKIYDLKIFMKPSEELRRYWKVQRDVHSRGYTKERVIEAIEKRMSDSISHILNQESEADIVFSIIGKSLPEGVPEEELGIDSLQLCITCANDIYFEQLLDKLRVRTDLNIAHEIDHLKQKIVIDGKVDAMIIREVAFSLGLDIEDLTGYNPAWDSDHLGLMQLFLLYQIITQFQRNGLLIKNDTI